MRNCANSSSSSAICRLEWRPSRCSQLACVALTLLALASLWLCELPVWLTLPAASVLSLRAGLLLHRERRALPFALSIPWDRQRAVSIAGHDVADFQVEWRGPLALLRWRPPGQRWQARLLWPDLLPPPARRELRLAIVARMAANTLPPMAS